MRYFVYVFNKIQLQTNKVCYKVSLCENVQRQSCSITIILCNVHRYWHETLVSLVLLVLVFGHPDDQNGAPECPNFKNKIKNGGLDQYGPECFGRPIFATIRKCGTSVYAGNF